MIADAGVSFNPKSLAVNVVEKGGRPRASFLNCEIGKNISFSTGALESFSSKNWQPVIYDALVVAAAVEFCDRSLRRSSRNWGRTFSVRVPVHAPDRWASHDVDCALRDALNLVTGDRWHFEFVPRRVPQEPPAQNRMEFPYDAEAVIAYSEGMDSYVVARLEGRRLGRRLVRVRVGVKRADVPKIERKKIPFAALPYEVKIERDNAERSARSRGFKFGLVAAIGAYLINAPSVVIPESGQGSLAPAILPVGQGYPDYRNHPLFAVCMEKFVNALLGHKVRYQFPRLWKTKGETLQEFIETVEPNCASWTDTRSCWQNSRQVSVSGHRRQCGVCAACMLRRLSVHAANAHEPIETYVWENLSASSFDKGANRHFAGFTGSMREYAIAGVLHLEHFSSIRSSREYELVKRRAKDELVQSLAESSDVVSNNLDRLLRQHETEWSAFKNDLGERSFVNKWINAAS